MRKHLSSFRALVPAAFLLAGGMFVSAAHANGVQWSVGINLPVPGVVVYGGQPAVIYAPPQPVYVQPRPVYAPPPVYLQPAPVYAPRVVYAPAPVRFERGWYPAQPRWRGQDGGERHHHHHRDWERGEGRGGYNVRPGY